MANAGRTIRIVGIFAVIAGVTGLVVALARFGGTDQRTPSLRATALQHERLIAACMRERGFEYAAAVPSSVLVEEARHAAAEAGRDEITAVRQAQARAKPDPNVAMVAELTPERQVAWGDALHGVGADAGCFYGTYRAAWGVDLGEVVAKGRREDDRVRADPSVRAAEATYRACMSARGFPVADTRDLPNVVERRRHGLDAGAADRLRGAAEAAQGACLPPYQQMFDQTTLRVRER